MKDNIEATENVSLKTSIINEIDSNGPLTRSELVDRIDEATESIDIARIELLDANRLTANADWEYDTR